MKAEMLEGTQAATNFQNAMRKIVTLPRAEFLKREAEYKRQSDANPKKRGPKKKASATSGNE